MFLVNEKIGVAIDTDEIEIMGVTDHCLQVATKNGGRIIIGDYDSGHDAIEALMWIMQELTAIQVPTQKQLDSCYLSEKTRPVYREPLKAIDGADIS